MASTTLDRQQRPLKQYGRSIDNGEPVSYYSNEARGSQGNERVKASPGLPDDKEPNATVDVHFQHDGNPAQV